MPNNTERTAAQEKKLLIAQGAMYRLGLTESAHAVRTSLQPDVLTRNAVSSLVTAASAAVGAGFNLKNIRNVNYQAILPVLMSGISLLAKRRSLLKPIVGGALAFAAAWTIARLILNRKAAAPDEALSDAGKERDGELQTHHGLSES